MRTDVKKVDEFLRSSDTSLMASGLSFPTGVFLGIATKTTRNVISRDIATIIPPITTTKNKTNG